MNEDAVMDFQDWLTSVATIEEVEQLLANIGKGVHIVDDQIPEFEHSGQYISDVYIANISPEGLQLAMRSALAEKYETVAGIVKLEISKSIPFGDSNAVGSDY